MLPSHLELCSMSSHLRAHRYSMRGKRNSALPSIVTCPPYLARSLAGVACMTQRLKVTPPPSIATSTHADDMINVCRRCAVAGFANWIRMQLGMTQDAPLLRLVDVADCLA